MKNRRLVLALLLFLLLSGAAGLGYIQLLSGLPSLESLPGRLNLPSVRLTDRNGKLLYEVLAEGGGRHEVLPLESFPLALRQATIATEDRSFYANPGIDLVGILRALWIDLRGGEAIAGGSTITQQVARNLLLDPAERGQRSLRRKLREAILAWQLTRRFSKDEILALYLNQTYYGGLAYGVEAAAQTYFGVPVSRLDLAESALLAGLPQAPARYNPFTDLDAARERQKVVLGLMQAAGFIDAEQQEAAGREPLVFAATPYPIRAPHFVMMVRSQLDRLFTPEQIYQHGGLVVRTSLDLDWQSLAEGAVARHLDELKRDESGLGHNLNNAALVALDPSNGEILALVGSPDYFDSAHAGALDMALAPRQPGSALKPILYAAALDPESPNPWTAATMLLDVRTSFLTHEGLAYTPANYDQKEHGPVLVRQALASSLNIPAVITLDHVGLGRLFEQAGKMGITTLQDPERYDLSLALGGGEVSLLELTAAYGAFASGGFKLEPVSILQVTDFNGDELYKAPPAPRVRVLDERLAWLISDILSDNDARQLGFGPNSILRLDRPAAVKTGTTSNFHDNWTVGYTPDLVVGVWAGNTSYEPMREVNGLTGAAPIWHQFMRAVLTGRPPRPFVQPPGLAQVEVCALSGALPTPACPYRRKEWFIDGTQPTTPDRLFQQVQVDALTGSLAVADTPPERRTSLTVLDLPPQAIPWAHAQGLRLLSDLLPGGGSTAGSPGMAGASPQSSPLQLVSPSQGSVFRLVAGYAPDAQRLLLEATGEAGLHAVTLWVDGILITRFDQGPYQAWWQLSAGTHQAWAQGLLADGHPVTSEKVTFEVK
jgi:penicillin-binding protein 1C